MIRAMMTAMILTCLGCGGGGSTAPTSPTPLATGTFGVRIADRCGGPPWFVSTVEIRIDGSLAGTAIPGGPAIVRQVPLGEHVVSGRSNTGLTWEGRSFLTATAPDSIRLFACA